MPITLAQIASNTASVPLPGGEPGDTITYYPGRITERVMLVSLALSHLTEASAIQAVADFNSTLASLIQKWDLLDVDGSMFPIDAARFPELPLTFRAEVFRAITGDMRPNTGATQSNQTQN